MPHGSDPQKRDNLQYSLTECVWDYNQWILFHEIDEIELRCHKTQALAFKIRIKEKCCVFGPHFVIVIVTSDETRCLHCLCNFHWLGKGANGHHNPRQGQAFSVRQTASLPVVN